MLALEKGSRNEWDTHISLNPNLHVRAPLASPHDSFHDPSAKLASLCFQDIVVRVQEKPKPLNRDAERASKRGNKHTKIKPTVYLKPASHLCKIATAA